MTDQPVRALLKQLHDTLGSAKRITKEDRELLEQLAADIQAALARSGAPAAGGQKSLADQLQAAVTRFEVSHPDLTAAMAQVSKQLGDMGI